MLHPSLCDPVDCGMPVSSVLHCLPEFAQILVHWIRDAIQPSYPSLPLFFLTSIFPSVRIFSNELALCIRWPEYWGFIFSISPSNEYSGLISFRIDWFGLLESKGLSSVFSNTTVQKHQCFGSQLLYGPTLTSIPDYWKNHSFDYRLLLQ